jgi:hypothetical protein
MRRFDASALGLSGLCLVHCLLLPVVAAFVPTLVVLTHAEWVHTAFLVVALPTTGLALWSVNRHHRPPAGLIALACMGLACLFVGAVGWPLRGWHEQITVAGSLLLVTTHIWNWRRGAAAHPVSAS